MKRFIESKRACGDVKDFQYLSQVTYQSNIRIKIWSRFMLLTAVLSLAACGGGVSSNPVAHNFAFVSPVDVDGNMGGLTGADDMCVAWASSAGIFGTYRAILSTSTVNARDRLAGARGWVRPDGRPLADLPADLFAPGEPLAALRLGPDGTDQGQQFVWSASRNTGTYNTNGGISDCGGWTSTVTESARIGFSDTTSSWLDRGSNEFCTNTNRVYCFQTDLNTPLDMNDFTESGRRMFVSIGNLDVTTGIAGADALCTDDVNNTAGLSGTFKALLADNGGSAAGRFAASATPIVRLDGLRVADNLAALSTMDLIHPPSLRANETYYSFRVFTGASLPNVAGTNANTCTGWTMASGNVTVGFPFGTSSSLTAQRHWFNGNGLDNCATRNNALPVYCLEE